MPKVEVRFRRTYQVQPYETESIEFCIWEEINVDDGYERKVTTEKILQQHAEKITELQSVVFHAMADKADELMVERLQREDPRDAAMMKSGQQVK